MKPLIIGEQPSKHGDPAAPLEGRIGRRLADCCAIEYSTYLERFERMNLLDVRAEYAVDASGKRNGNGHAFNVKLAALRAETLAHNRFEPGLTVIVCGKRAAAAFRIKQDYFALQRVNGAAVYVVPHPSGANRWWNAEDNVRRMSEFMTQLARSFR